MFVLKMLTSMISTSPKRGCVSLRVAGPARPVRTPWRRGLGLCLPSLLFWFFLLGLVSLGFAPLSLADKLTNAQVAQIPAGDQPIRFSHWVHATEYQIPCQYCHIYARRAATAGIPPVAICWGCHQLAGQQLDEVKKVVGYWERKEPIPWVKVHDLPEFVRFSHAKHVNAKNELFPTGVACERCHGDIAQQEVLEKPLEANFGTMGWCLDCHLSVPGAMEAKRAIPASAATPTVLRNAKRPDGTHRPHLTDCYTCHK